MIEQLAKITIIMGVILIFFGGVFWLFGKIPFMGKLPGDILIKKENFTFWAPITTTILISLIISLILTFIANLKK